MRSPKGHRYKHSLVLALCTDCDSDSSNNLKHWKLLVQSCISLYSEHCTIRGYFLLKVILSIAGTYRSSLRFKVASVKMVHCKNNRLKYYFSTCFQKNSYKIFVYSGLVKINAKCSRKTWEREAEEKTLWDVCLRLDFYCWVLDWAETQEFVICPFVCVKLF